MSEFSTYVDVAEALHDLGDNRDVVKDTHGNVSGRTGKYQMHIKPSGFPYERITPNHLVRVHWEDNGLEKVDNSVSGLNPSVDWPHHLRIYEEFWRVGGICHTHSPYATAFAIARKDIVCASTEQADYFGGDIKCLPYSDLSCWGGDLVRYVQKKGQTTPDSAYLLAGHGVITFGKSPQDAVKFAVEVENIAQKMFLATALSNTLRDPKRLHEADVKSWNIRYNNVYGQR